mgnify:CR=1 FL=1
MKIYLQTLFLILSVIFSACTVLRDEYEAEFPIQQIEVPPAAAPVETPPDFDAASWYAARVRQPDLHAALVVGLDSGKKFAEYNADKLFNPASLVKLTTTLAALKKLGAEYRFPVRVLTGGEVDQNGVLHGDLYFAGTAPIFNEISAGVIAEELKKRGIERITGKVYVTPDFTFNFHENPEQSAALLARNLRLKNKPESGVSAQPTGKELFVFRSYPLREILLYMNTFSSNFVAHRVGDAVGGAEGVRQFLISELGFPPEKIQLQTTSGLEENALTAREVFQVLRALRDELQRQDLTPVEVLPMAAERASTLEHRLTETNFKNATVGKTGTFSAADGGIGMASFAGLIYTQNQGVIAYVLISEGATTAEHKKMQDQFLKEVLGNRIQPNPFGFDTQRKLLPKAELLIEETIMKNTTEAG